VVAECDAIAVDFVDVVLLLVSEQGGCQDADYEDDCVFHGILLLCLRV
jgi:hypothetical protein